MTTNEVTGSQTAPELTAEQAQTRQDQLAADPVFVGHLMSGHGPAHRSAHSTWIELGKVAGGASPTQTADNASEPSKSASSTERAVDAALRPGASVDDYRLELNLEGVDVNEAAALDKLARQAAFDVGAPPMFARDTIKVLQEDLARSAASGSQPDYTAAKFTEHLKLEYGPKFKQRVSAAQAAFAKMSPEAREWLSDSLDAASMPTATWVIGRLADLYAMRQRQK